MKLPTREELQAMRDEICMHGIGVSPAEALTMIEASEAALEMRDALQALVNHDRAADKREGLLGCLELQNAEAILARYPVVTDNHEEGES